MLQSSKESTVVITKIESHVVNCQSNMNILLNMSLENKIFMDAWPAYECCHYVICSGSTMSLCVRAVTVEFIIRHPM